jgi:hypothetical protein
MTTLYCDIYNLASTQIADLIKKDYEKKYNTVATSQYIEFALGKKNIQNKIFSRIIEMILTVFKEVSVIKQLILYAKITLANKAIAFASISPLVVLFVICNLAQDFITESLLNIFKS